MMKLRINGLKIDDLNMVSRQDGKLSVGRFTDLPILIYEEEITCSISRY